MNIEDIKNGIENGKTIHITNYVKEADGKSRLTRGVSDVSIKVDTRPYSEILKESIQLVSRVPLSEQKRLEMKHQTDRETVKKAMEEVSDSLRKSLSVQLNESPSAPKTRKTNPNKFITKGLEVSPDGLYVYLSGEVVEETVKIKPTYKPVKSKPKTLVKKDINAKLPINIKKFKVPIGEISKISLSS